MLKLPAPPGSSSLGGGPAPGPASSSGWSSMGTIVGARAAPTRGGAGGGSRGWGTTWPSRLNTTGISIWTTRDSSFRPIANEKPR